jgi:hypothetical protein
MIRFRRSGRTKNGRIQDGIQYAKEIAEYLSAKYAPHSVQVYTELFGENNTIHWYTDFEDLATLDRVFMQVAADESYWAMVSKGTDIFIDGSFHDTLQRSA